jgi:hypothetical protein
MRFRRPKPTTTEEVFAEILKYCEMRDEATGIGGAITQEPYKFDYFDIFYNAFYNARCGGGGWRKLNQASKRGRKRAKTSEYVVTADGIREYLDDHWKRAKIKRNREMIDLIVQWWEHWCYAWDHHPVGLPRKYYRKPKPASDRTGTRNK